MDMFTKLSVAAQVGRLWVSDLGLSTVGAQVSELCMPESVWSESLVVDV